ncbi:uncharacterized protein VNE69_09177 [Vairimorpha necatrix]|uniref:Zinc-ribbon 15 domain-containing protein n=1 Tax=Vairimorpha necatrix TaxID=6039 RepID=A0AAX4JF61_9MICR
MCDPCCLFVDYKSKSRFVQRPFGYTILPDKIFCPYCSQVTRPVYRKNEYIFRVCFIPLIPCIRGYPYVACQGCKNKIGRIQKECSECHVSRPFEGDYCMICGTP